MNRLGGKLRENYGIEPLLSYLVLPLLGSL